MKVRIPTVHSDQRGDLFEAYGGGVSEPIAMTYVVTINPGFGRDKERWHYHEKKEETFLCVSGEARLAIRDHWDGSYHVFFLSENNHLMVTANRRDWHSVIAYGQKLAVLVVFCDTDYNPEDELREPMTEEWNWDKWLMNPQ